MPPQETGKQRASRIPLDYYKQPNALERWKNWLTGAALLLTGGWLVAGLLQSDEGRGRYSRGPVANVHVAWEDNCSACHDSFTPISGNSWASEFLPNPHASNDKCIACHQGPPHQKKGVTDPDCASCHLDHRGRDASLVRVPDSACTQCHRDLASHGASGKPEDGGKPYQNSIGRFAPGDHPDFRSLKGGNPDSKAPDKDPGRLQFNHQKHLTAGMGTGFTIQKIPDAGDQTRYRLWQPAGMRKLDSKVQLNCTSCHQLDGRPVAPMREAFEEVAGEMVRGKGPQGLLIKAPRHDLPPLKPARSPGAYMLPIIYENQCQACHPLSFSRKDQEDSLSSRETVKHRLNPKETYDYLQGYYADKFLREEWKDFDQFVPGRPLPGKSLLGKEGVKAKEMIADKVHKAMRDLYIGRKSCGECHFYQDGVGQPVISPKLDSPPFGFVIEPTKVPQVWLKHAVFNHAAHRAVDCRSCHGNAYPLTKDGKENPQASKVHDDVLIPGINNCAECHAPKTKTNGELHGGARFTCVECHRYHGGDPLQGIGARASLVDDQHRRDIQHFLWNKADK